MNKLKALLLAGLLLGSASLVKAEDEAPAVANFGQSEIGVFYTSSRTTTGSATTDRTYQIRKLGASDQGDLFTIGGWREVNVTTGIGRSGAYGAGTSTLTFAVNSSSWVGATTCRGLQDNCNVIRLASLASPLFVDHVDVGDVNGPISGGGGGMLSGPGRVAIRMFDSRGSTDVAGQFFYVSSSSGAVFSVSHWCSSGTTLAIDGLANVTVHMGKQTR